MFFNVLANYSNADDRVGDAYKFLAFLSIFHKYDIFIKLGQNQVNSNALNYRQLKSAVEDSEGPSQKLTSEIVNHIFKD